MKKLAAFIEHFRKTNSFKQLHVALKENSNISFVFCYDLEDESRYVWGDHVHCLPDANATNTTEYPTTEAPISNAALNQLNLLMLFPSSVLIIHSFVKL